MTELTPRQHLLKEVALQLGAGMVKVELTPDHYNLAFDMALDRYRQRSVNAVEERIAFMDLQAGQSSYYLPHEVIEVREVYRRGVPGLSGGGVYFDPFAASFANQFAMIGTGDAGNLTTFELYSEFQNMVGMMFGQYIVFFWHSAEHRLDLMRDIESAETIGLWVYNYRPEELLLKDTYARPWLRSYTIAQCQLMLANARGKFANMPGPTGGVSLNAASLEASANATLERLEKECATQVDANMGYGLLHG